jgi:hypothetical protein
MCNQPPLTTQNSNAIERERELAPRLGYLDAPPAPSGCAVPGAAAAAGMPTPSADAAVTPQMRAIVASWLSEVAAEFRMQQETLFLAVSLLDRFQAASPAVRFCPPFKTGPLLVLRTKHSAPSIATPNQTPQPQHVRPQPPKQGVPRNVLQLVAVAAVMLASKRDEVAHPTVDEFTEIAADAFKVGPGGWFSGGGGASSRPLPLCHGQTPTFDRLQPRSFFLSKRTNPT